MTDNAEALVLVYVTASDANEAVAIARAVVSARLAACANILPALMSVYWWDGALQEGEEVVLILKTRAELLEQLTTEIKRLHSYECPCVVAMPILGGNPDFLAWARAETTDSA